MFTSCAWLRKELVNGLKMEHVGVLVIFRAVDLVVNLVWVTFPDDVLGAEADDLRCWSGSKLSHRRTAYLQACGSLQGIRISWVEVP